MQGHSGTSSQSDELIIRVMYLGRSTTTVNNKSTTQNELRLQLQSRSDYASFRLSRRRGVRAGSASTSAMSASPIAHIPADHTSSSELMQKKLIVCPISSQEPVAEPRLIDSRGSRAAGDVPVSVTFRKNVIVITAGAEHGHKPPCPK